MNTVTIGGRISRAPDMRYFESGKVKTSLSVALDNGKDKEGKKRDATFVEVVAWGRVAELLGEHFIKGDFLLVTGRLEQEKWEQEDGQKRSKLLVNVDRIGWCPKRSAGAAANSGGTEEDYGLDADEVSF